MHASLSGLPSEDPYVQACRMLSQTQEQLDCDTRPVHSHCAKHAIHKIMVLLRAGDDGALLLHS